MALTQSEDYQAPTLPTDIDPNDPNALSRLMDVSKRLVLQYNELYKRVKDLEDIVLN